MQYPQYHNKPNLSSTLTNLIQLFESGPLTVSILGLLLLRHRRVLRRVLLLLLVLLVLFHLSLLWPVEIIL